MLTLIILFSCVGHLDYFVVHHRFLLRGTMAITFRQCLRNLWTQILFNSVQFRSVASSIGSYILNVKVAGNLYDREAKKQMAALGLVRRHCEDPDCKGVECFKSSFIIITAATLFGTVVSFLLALGTRKFYKSDIYNKFREDIKVTEKEMARADNRILSSEIKYSGNGVHRPEAKTE
ncbi:hypothetical protein GQ457_14G000620 [Hibiscus cannabinus]